VITNKYGRNVAQVDAIGRTNRTDYGVPTTRQMTHTDPAGFTWVETYDRKGHLTAQADPLGNTTSYTYDALATVAASPSHWDGRPRLATTTGPMSFRGRTRWARSRAGTCIPSSTRQFGRQPGRLDDSYTYDAPATSCSRRTGWGRWYRTPTPPNGLVLTAADANGHFTTVGYDGNGFLVARMDPATNTTRYGLNELGWKLAETTRWAKSRRTRLT